jgi:cell division protein FtsN
MDSDSDSQMANLDRGAYDADKLHDFETDEMEDDNEKSRLPLLVLIALVVLAAFGGVVWLAYTQGVERGRADVPRIAMTQPAPKAQRVAASPYAGLNIYQPSTATPSDVQTTGAVPPPPKPLAATHAANTPPPLRPSATTPQEPPLPAPTVLNSQHARQDIPRQTVEQKPASVPPRAKAQPAPVSHAERPVSHEEKAAAPEDTDKAPPPAVEKGILLQIGSYKSDAEAMRSWAAFKSRHAVAASYRPDIQKVDLGAKGIWYRLRLGALADKKSAISLCGKLKAQGAACLLAR